MSSASAAVASSSSAVRPGAFLRRVLFADAAVSLATGALMAAAAQPLAGPLGIPSSLMLGAGLALFPYAAYLLWLATRERVARAAVWAPIVLNLLWAADCVWLLAGGIPSPTIFGEVFIGLHIVTVLVFAELEFIGLRRSAA